MNVRQFLRVLFTSGGKPQQISEDREEKHERSRPVSHYGFFITAVPPELSKVRFEGGEWVCPIW